MSVELPELGPTGRDRSMQGRSLFVAEQIIRLLDRVGQLAADDEWDGRELLTGTAIAFKQICVALNVSPQAALGIVRGVDAPALTRNISLLVGPSGRPLDAPPPDPAIRIVGGRRSKLIP